MWWCPKIDKYQVWIVVNLADEDARSKVVGVIADVEGDVGELFYDLSCRVSNSSHFDDSLTTAFSQFGDRFKLLSHGLDHWRLSHNSEPSFFRSLNTIQHHSELVKESNSQENHKKM